MVWYGPRLGPARLERRGGNRDLIARKPVSRAGRARPISRWRFEFHRKERILFLFLAACAFLLSPLRREEERLGAWNERRVGQRFEREARAAFIRAFERLHAPPAWIFDGTASKTLSPIEE